MVSGSLHVSNSFVSPYSNSFVSQSGWWCPALCMSPIHSSSLIAIHLSPRFAGSVRLSGWFQLSHSFVSQSGWWCPALRMSPIHFSFSIAIHLSPSLADGVGSPDVSTSFVSPCNSSFVSQSGWWCAALRMSPIDLSPFPLPCLIAGWQQNQGMLAIHLSPIVAGGFRLSACLQLTCFPL